MASSTDNPPSRAQLRRLFGELFPLDSDQDAFCGDYFPLVKRRMAAQCDRTAKTNLFLEAVAVDEIWAILRRHYREALKKHAALLSDEPDQTAAQQRERLNAELRRLHEALRTCESIGVPTDQLRAHIIKVRRDLRRGRQVVEQDVLGHRYRLLERLGQGGVSTIWIAQDTRPATGSSEVVAIKILLGQHNENQSIVRRFQRGAQQMASLEHPSIVRVLDGPHEDDELHFFVLEYLAGGDLRVAVENQRIRDEEVIRVVLEVGTALQFAHENKLIHRDVTPSNILLAKPGPAKLTDFDLVLPKEHSTLVGREVQGTLAFAAPELLDGSLDEAYDPRLDVYSLGMTTLYGLSGRPVSVMRRSREVPRMIAALPYGTALQRVLMRALAEQADARFSSMRDFCDELRAAWDERTLAERDTVHTTNPSVNEGTRNSHISVDARIRVSSLPAPALVSAVDAFPSFPSPSSASNNISLAAELSLQRDRREVLAGFLQIRRRWAPLSLLVAGLLSIVWLKRDRWQLLSIASYPLPPRKSEQMQTSPPAESMDRAEIPPPRAEPPADAGRESPTEAATDLAVATALARKPARPLNTVRNSAIRSPANGQVPRDVTARPADADVDLGKKERAAEWVELGKRKLKGGIPAGAEVAFRNALELVPDDKDALWGLAQVQARQSDPNDAVNTLRKLATRYPSWVEPQERLADVLYSLGDYKAAVETCYLILARQPGSVNAKRVLERARRSLSYVK